MAETENKQFDGRLEMESIPGHRMAVGVLRCIDALDLYSLKKVFISSKVINNPLYLVKLTESEAEEVVEESYLNTLSKDSIESQIHIMNYFENSKVSVPIVILEDADFQAGLPKRYPNAKMIGKTETFNAFEFKKTISLLFNHDLAKMNVVLSNLLNHAYSQDLTRINSQFVPFSLFGALTNVRNRVQYLDEKNSRENGKNSSSLVFVQEKKMKNDTNMNNNSNNKIKRRIINNSNANSKSHSNSNSNSNPNSNLNMSHIHGLYAHLRKKDPISTPNTNDTNKKQSNSSHSAHLSASETSSSLKLVGPHKLRSLKTKNSVNKELSKYRNSQKRKYNKTLGNDTSEEKQPSIHVSNQSNVKYNYKSNNTNNADATLNNNQNNENSHQDHSYNYNGSNLGRITGIQRNLNKELGLDDDKDLEMAIAASLEEQNVNSNSGNFDSNFNSNFNSNCNENYGKYGENEESDYNYNLAIALSASESELPREGEPDMADDTI